MDIHQPKDLKFKGLWFKRPQIAGFWNPGPDFGSTLDVEGARH